MRVVRTPHTNTSRYDVERKSLGENESTIAHDQGFKITYDVTGLVETERPILAGVLIGEPVLQRESNFPEILLPEHIFVPNNKLEDTELVGERKVDRKIKGGIFGVVDRINGLLGDGVCWRELSTDTTTRLSRTGCSHGSLVPPRSFPNKFMQPSTCSLKMTMGGSAGADDRWFLPLPLPARIAGTRVSESQT